ncbi:MAG: TetR/AcrR family transcriptional regulator [Acidimicrobiales bacterium]
MTDLVATTITSDDDTPPVTREVQGEATRARLVAVAVTALEKGGEGSVKIRDIAHAMGVSVGAVYHHFESREDLIVAARLAQFEGLISGDVDAIRQLADTAETVDDMRRGMRFLNRAAHSAARSDFRQLRSEVVGVARHNDGLAAALSAAQERCTAELVEVVIGLQEKGLANPALDPRAVATFLQAIALGLVLDDINTDQPMDREAWHSLTDTVYEVFLGPGPS